MSTGEPKFHLQSHEPRLKVGRTSFALPVVNYRGPSGSFTRGRGIIIGRDLSPNTSVGLGFFKMKPRHQEDSYGPPVPKSRKIAVGVSMRF